MANLLETLNPRQRKFAEFLATGDMTPGRAYEEAGFSSRGSNAATSGHRLSKNVKISAYVREIRAEAAKAGKEAAIMTIHEKREFLARVKRTPIGQVKTDSDLCQEHARSETESGTFEKFKMPSKLDAIKLDSLLAGELTDPKRDVSVSVSVVISEEKRREIHERRKQALEAHGRN